MQIDEEAVVDIFKYLIFNMLHVSIDYELSCIAISVVSRLRVLYGVVLGSFSNVSKCYKSLIINMLNSIYIVADVAKYAYLCEAKVPYYGRSTYRHRAFDNASPLQDAAGNRGIVCRRWTIV